jgi:hypothetical protein
MSDAVDPAELLEQIRADKRTLAWAPLAPSTELGLLRQHPLREHEALAYLHAHWALPDAPDAAAFGGGLRGRVLRLFARLAFRVLAPYLRSERDLLANLVRVNDALARRCDELADTMAMRHAEEAANEAGLAAWLQDRADRLAGSGKTDDDAGSA